VPLPDRLQQIADEILGYLVNRTAGATVPIVCVRAGGGVGGP
jgi:hypothetical protein